MDECDSDVWKTSCVNCDVCRESILRKLIFTAANCLISNKIKNYNSLIVSRVAEKRK